MQRVASPKHQVLQNQASHDEQPIIGYITKAELTPRNPDDYGYKG